MIKLITKGIPVHSTNPTRPPYAEYDVKSRTWTIRTSYPDANSCSGSVLVLGADGSVSEITFDNDGFVVSETQIKRKEG
ncbi:MAG: hypothetical protein MN733_03375 [Nitrososphaera sp.]|nr:hypothetical protein [Nitrososphaera sp.]